MSVVVRGAFSRMVGLYAALTRPARLLKSSVVSNSGFSWGRCYQFPVEGAWPIFQREMLNAPLG